MNNDFSRRHLCQNPPALAGGRLRQQGYSAAEEFLSRIEAEISDLNENK